MRREKVALHWRILVGFFVGVALGLAVYSVHVLSVWPRIEPVIDAVRTYGTQPVATVFLRSIFMLVMPLLFSALVMGVLEMGDVRVLGRIGWRTLAYTAVMSALAVALGLFLVDVFRPGAGVDQALAAKLLAQNAERAGMIVSDVSTAPKGLDLVLSIVPDNVVAAASANKSILSVMYFAVMLGIGLLVTRTQGTETLQRAIQGIFDVSMTLISLILRLAPYAVACLMFDMTVVFGWDLLAKLAGYVAVVIAALALHLFVTYSLALWLVGGWSPWAFFRGARDAMLIAFSTASSNATLPTALRVADEQLHLPRHVARFVLTVGATANQNGTALFEGVTVIFLAQFFGVELTFLQQVTVMVVCILGGIGTAGVPSGSLPVVALICSMVGVPPEGIGLILGVNHLLDMCRTTLNVTGDLALAAMVSRGEASSVLQPARGA